MADWSDGVSLEARSGRTLQELRHRCTADRFTLALDCRRRALALSQQQPPMFRDAASRSYYATYHALRAVVYFVECGDDHSGHSDLQQRIPADFPEVDTWKNNLKVARETRNRADYNLYPKADSAWKVDRDLLAVIADDAITTVRAYLKEKGCSYL